MNHSPKYLLAALVVCAAVVLGSGPAAADSYLTVNGGVFLPLGDADELDAGPTANVVYGFGILPMLWGEVGAGYAKAEKGATTLAVIPVTLNAKVRLPLPLVKPYALAGVGAYRATLDAPGVGSDDALAFGYQAAVGVDVKILLVKLNVEAEYFRSEPELHGDTVKLEGVLATVGVGFEF